ncbi:MAG: hypothetical protein M3Q07_24500 [Pseudobdellovibrionaceae bacterium]|nr:hypothetical protein [Pseudobdellovibrionaceae bacterium]
MKAIMDFYKADTLGIFKKGNIWDQIRDIWDRIVATVAVFAHPTIAASRYVFHSIAFVKQSEQWIESFLCGVKYDVQGLEEKV